MRRLFHCVFPRARMDLKLRAIVVKLFTTDGKFSFIKIGTQLVVLCALVLGLVAFVGNNKTVTLNVDGKVSSVQSFGGTVGQVVKSANVELKPADRVSPSADVKVENGTVINVNMAKAVKVSLDGAEKTVSTTAPDVAGLVTELGIASASSVSVPKDAQLAVARFLRFHLHPQDASALLLTARSPRPPRRREPSPRCSRTPASLSASMTARPSPATRTW